MAAARLTALSAERAALLHQISELRAKLTAVAARIATVATTAPAPRGAVPAEGAPPAAAAAPAGGPKAAPPGGTERLYFEDTYRFTATATVLSISPLPDGKHTMVLDRTIFHPQGGGQPSDTGSIKGHDWGFAVGHVAARKEDNVIEHHGAFDGAPPAALNGSVVNLSVDPEARSLHARLHSAGHLLDTALANLGRHDLEPGKGYHFKAGPYVEYIGAVANEDRESLAAAVSKECQRLIDAKIPTAITTEINKDSGQPMRVVNVGGCTCPCGGTHVQNTEELKSITVTRIKKVKKNVKFSYTVG